MLQGRPGEAGGFKESSKTAGERQRTFLCRKIRRRLPQHDSKPKAEMSPCRCDTGRSSASMSPVTEFPSKEKRELHVALFPKISQGNHQGPAPHKSEAKASALTAFNLSQSMRSVQQAPQSQRQERKGGHSSDEVGQKNTWPAVSPQPSSSPSPNSPCSSTESSDFLLRRSKVSEVRDLKHIGRVTFIVWPWGCFESCSQLSRFRDKSLGTGT